MFLVVKTDAECGLEDSQVAEVAVLAMTPAVLDRWEALMDKARQVSAEMGTQVALGFEDTAPDFYRESFWDMDELTFLETHHGKMLHAFHPFYEPDSEDEAPLDLVYCEIQVHSDALRWIFGPTEGEVQEYTYDITRADLGMWRAQLQAILERDCDVCHEPSETAECATCQQALAAEEEDARNEA